MEPYVKQQMEKNTRRQIFRVDIFQAMGWMLMSGWVDVDTPMSSRKKKNQNKKKECNMQNKEVYLDGIHFDLGNLPSKVDFKYNLEQLDLMATRQLAKLLFDELKALPKPITEVIARDIQHDGNHYKTD